jgi:hypothetical protein
VPCPGASTTVADDGVRLHRGRHTITFATTPQRCSLRLTPPLVRLSPNANHTRIGHAPDNGPRKRYFGPLKAEVSYSRDWHRPLASSNSLRYSTPTSTTITQSGLRSRVARSARSNTGCGPNRSKIFATPPLLRREPVGHGSLCGSIS